MVFHVVEEARIKSRHRANMKIFLLMVVVTSVTRGANAAGGYTKGKKFIVSFLYNHGTKDTSKTANYLFISSEAPGKVNVKMAKVEILSAWEHDYTLSPMSTITVTLPDQSEMPNTMAVQPRGIHITSNVDISVYAMNDDVSISSADAAVVLPVTALSRTYLVPSVEINPVIAVAAVLPNTVVTVTLQTDCLITYHGTQYTRNGVITETLGEFDVLQIQSKYATSNDCDFGGTTVSSNNPVAVFSGSSCYFSPASGCDHLMQQVLPDELLGTNFIIPDLADSSSYRVRLLATADSTNVFVNEHHKDFTTHSYQVELDKGAVREIQVPDGTDLEVFSNKHLSVTQLDGSPAPFSITIPPVESYGWNYTISTMNNPTSSNFISYVNLVIHRNSAGTLTIDGVHVVNSKWRRVRDLGYSVATVSISSGSHRIVADDRFMVQVYGYDGIASYGYQAGYYLHTLPSEHLAPTNLPTFPSLTTTRSSHVSGPCDDSKGVDCQVLDATLSICQTPDSPKHLCRKHCGFCCPSGSCSVVG